MWDAQKNSMDDIRDILRWLRPELDAAQVKGSTRFVEDLQMTSLDGLSLVAMVEARYGRTFDWDIELNTIADLLGYLTRQGIEMED